MQWSQGGRGTANLIKGILSFESCHFQACVHIIKCLQRADHCPFHVRRHILSQSQWSIELPTKRMKSDKQ